MRATQPERRRSRSGGADRGWGGAGAAGGGVFMPVQPAGGTPVVIDYFARAPRAARPDLYPLVDEIGSDGVGYTGVERDANANGARSVAVPGTVAGLSLALERFGSI